MNPTVHLRVDDLAGEEVQHLLTEHVAEMRRISPPDAAFALDLEGLRAPDMTVWSAWIGDTVVGCCAMRQLDGPAGEIKSMRTAGEYRGHGVGAYMLRHLISTARSRGYPRLFLETGSTDAFRDARAFYARHGFVACGPFGDYAGHPHSAFMTLELS